MRIACWATLIVLGAGPAVFGQGAEMHVNQTLAGTGFTGAPYSAKETTVNAKTTGGGVKYFTTYVTLLWRDAAGRTRGEQLGKSQSGLDFHSVTVLDPVAGISLRWPVTDDSAKKVVTISALPAWQKVTEPVTSRFGLPSANPSNPNPSPAPYSCPDCTVKTEFFPARKINGVDVVGWRTTRTYKAGTMDNGQDFVATSTDETWTSPDLRINVLYINDRPELGKTTINVTDIVPGAPDPALFHAPAGYQVLDTRGTTTPTGGPGGAGRHGVNGLNGMWLNVGSGNADLVQIATEGMTIHPYGACHPNLCDWGIMEGKTFAARVDSSGVAAMTAQKETGFSEVTLTLILEANGRLRVDEFTRFTDGSKRADYHHVDYLTRDLRPAPIAAQQHQPAAQSPAAPGGNRVLVVWSVGSPASNETPDSKVPLNLERKAESMGLRLQIRAFPAREFAQEFQNAFAAHREPDIIAVENAFTIESPSNNPYGVNGIASDPDVRRSLIQVNGSLHDLAGHRGGWQYLISTSEHAEAARRLALRAPECDASPIAETPLPPDLQKAAVRITDAYLHAPAEMEAYDDADRLTTEGVRLDSVNVRETKACGHWGNDRLTFVSVVSTFEREDPRGQPSPISNTHGPLIGQMPILLVLRKQENQWRLLAASSDPWSTGDFLGQIPVFSRLLGQPAVEETGPAPATLLLPEDGQVPVPDAGQRFGNFTWQPSRSGTVVAQIAEFAYQNDDRLFFIPIQNDAAQNRVSAGSLWGSGIKWKWRVWSISDTGAIAFSDSRTFRQ